MTTNKKIFLFLIIILAIGVLVWQVSTRYDWKTFYLPSAQAALIGRNPYLPGIFNPPWFLIITVPFALLPEPIGGKLFCFVNGLILSYASLRLANWKFDIGLFLLSPLVVSHYDIDG